MFSISRLNENNDIDDPYMTEATVTFESGERIPFIAFVLDATAEGKKKSTTIGTVIIEIAFSPEATYYIDILRNQNIRTIEIEGHKIEMLQKMKLKTASIIDDMFKEVFKKGYRLTP